MTNLFDFDYTSKELLNVDGTPSNFRQVFGKNGINTICPKSTYHIVKTEDLSTLGHAFIDKGHNVKTFDHRNGEVIGLTVDFGKRNSKVGDCNYQLYIKVPNNNGGKGYLSIKQVRLICTNGMVSNTVMHKEQSIKIPHTMNYKHSIDLMKQSIDTFTYMLKEVENRDEFLNGQEIDENKAMFELNKWFFEYEMPKGHKEGLTLDDFRKSIAIEPETIKCIERYNELKRAFNLELGYNKELSLKLSMYTVFASVTNYLTRRVEKSNSTASTETQDERASKKLVYFNIV